MDKEYYELTELHIHSKILDINIVMDLQLERGSCYYDTTIDKNDDFYNDYEKFDKLVLDYEKNNVKPENTNKTVYKNGSFIRASYNWLKTSIDEKYTLDWSQITTIDMIVKCYYI